MVLRIPMFRVPWHRPSIFHATKFPAVSSCRVTNAFRPRSFITSVPRRASKDNPKFTSSENPFPSYLQIKPLSYYVSHFKSWDPRIQIAVVIFGSGVVYYIYHLEQAPVTGRLRFMDISPEAERKIASKSYDLLVAQYEGKIVPQGHIATRFVEHIVNRILAGSDLGQVQGADQSSNTDFAGGTPGDTWSDGFTTDGDNRDSFHNAPVQREWKVMVINDDSIVNALVVNGTIVVFTGIFPICQDENGLAAVIGHEIAHVVARHNAERLSSKRLMSLFFLALGLLFDFGYSSSQILATYALEYPNSRVQELEADKIGLLLTAQACYDPQSASDVQNRLAALEKNGPLSLEMLRTHPLSTRRAKILESYLPDAHARQAASSFCGGLEATLKAFTDTVTSTST